MRLPSNSPPQERDCLVNKRILIVENQPLLVELLVTVMERAGMEAYSAESVREALKAVQEHDPHILLIDFRMPGGDGLSLIEQIPAGRVRCLLIYSNSLSEDNIRRAEQLGVRRLFVKPMSPAAMIQQMRNTIAQFLAGIEIE